MSNTLPFIILCTADAQPNARLTMAALGQGPETFSRTLAPAMPTPTSSTTPTFYLSQDMGGTDDLVVILNALTLGILPDKDADGDDVAWGVGGIISGADALAAFGGGKVQIRTGSGLVTAQDRDNWRDDTLTVMGLAFIPSDL